MPFIPPNITIPKTPPSPSLKTIECKQLGNKLIHVDTSPDEGQFFDNNEPITPDLLQWIGRVEQQFPSFSLSSTVGSPKFPTTNKEYIYKKGSINLHLNELKPQPTSGYLLLRIFNIHLYNSSTIKDYNVILKQSLNSPSSKMKGLDRKSGQDGVQDTFLIKLNPQTNPSIDYITIDLVEPKKEKKNVLQRFIKDHFKRSSPLQSTPTLHGNDHKIHLTIPLRTMFNNILEGAMQTISTFGISSSENISKADTSEYIPGTMAPFLSNTNGLIGAPQICGNFFLQKDEEVVGEVGLHLIASNSTFSEGNVVLEDKESEEIVLSDIEYPFKENVEYQQYLTVMVNDHSWDRMWVVLSGGKLHFQHHLHREIENAGILDLSTVKNVEKGGSFDGDGGLENVIRITFEDMTELLAFADDEQRSLAWVNALYKEIWDKDLEQGCIENK